MCDLCEQTTKREVRGKLCKHDMVIGTPGHETCEHETTPDFLARMAEFDPPAPPTESKSSCA